MLLKNVAQIMDPLRRDRDGNKSCIQVFRFGCKIRDLLLSFPFETEGRHVSTEAHEAIDHLAQLCQVERRFHNRDSNRQPLP